MIAAGPQVTLSVADQMAFRQVGREEGRDQKAKKLLKLREECA